MFSLQGTQPRTDPIIIKIMDPPSDLESLGDVLLGALGIAGVIAVAALVTGLVFAGVIYLVRKYQSDPQGPVA